MSENKTLTWDQVEKNYPYLDGRTRKTEPKVGKTSQEVEDWFKKATSDRSEDFQRYLDSTLVPMQSPNINGPFTTDPYKRYGPPPQRGLQDPPQINELVNKYFKKSSFEEILNEIFSTSEKEQFLIDIGYLLEFDHSDGAYDIFRLSPTKEKIRESRSFSEIFLKEITIKFKNLLLSKATLKLKL